MKKRLYILLFFIISLPLLVYPCRCEEVTIAQSVKYSDIVIKGKVLSVIKIRDYEKYGIKIDTTGLDDYTKKYKYFAPLYFVSVKIEKVYKGKSVADTITIITPTQGRTCGYQYFEAGLDMIIYGTRKFPSLGVMSISSAFPIPITDLPPNYFWTSSCLRTTCWYRQEENEILKILESQD